MCAVLGSVLDPRQTVEAPTAAPAALAVVMAASPPARTTETPASPAPDPTAVYIRKLAGLPAASARGDIELVDAGHGPMDTMISIVAIRTGAGWHASYACAASPFCRQDQDHDASDYDLPRETSQQVDLIVRRLQEGSVAEDQPPAALTLCGRLAVRLNLGGVVRVFRRSCEWGQPLGDLERLLKPPETR